MELVILIFCGILSFFSWILWGLLAGCVFFAGILIPWGLWEGFMFLTFNNIINAFAKLPGWLGAFVGFVLALPFVVISVTIAIWSYIQTILMGILTFNGCAGSEFCNKFIEKLVVPWEGSCPKSFCIVRYYYDHCQWLWGGSGFFHGWFPWQNGCGGGWVNGDFWWPVGSELPIPFACLKLFLLAIPYLALFVLPLLPVFWSFFRPIVAACASLPSISGNGDGRD